MKRFPLRNAAPVVGLLLLVILTFGRSVAFDFVWDDHSLIPNNPQVRGEASWKEVWTTHFFQGPRPGRQGWMYRPLVISSFRMNWAMAGGAPWPFHATNVALHLGTVLLCFAIARQLGVSQRAAWLIAAAFAVWPIHSETVPWSSGRPDLLLGLGLAAALYSAMSQQRVAWFFVAAGWSVALLSKESAVPFAAVLLLIVLKRAVSWRARVGGAALVLMPLIIALALRYHALGGLLFNADLPGDHSLFGRLLRLGLLTQMLTGFFVAALPELPTGGVPYWGLIATGAIFIVVMVLVAVVAWRRHRTVSLLIAGALATLIPTMAVRLPALRYLYVPGLCLMLAMAPAIDGAFARFRARSIYAVCGALIAMWLAFTSLRVDAWRNDDMIFAMEVALNPQNPDAHYQLGGQQLKRGDADAAAKSFIAALQLFAGHRPSWLGLTEAHLAANRPVEAERIIRGSLRGKPHTAPQFALLGRALAAQRRYDEALGAFEQALALDLTAVDAWAGAAKAALGAGRHQDAHRYAKGLLARVPGHPDGLSVLRGLQMR